MEELNINNLSEEQLKELAQLAKKSIYVQRKWRTVLKMSPQQAIVLLNMVYLKYIDMEKFPRVVKKKRKDGGEFLKLEIPLTIGIPMEADLSYENVFKENDHLDPDTLVVCVEKFMEEQHIYITGSVL